uniref:Alpha-S1-casein n=1 Tax=Ailuropoda melanoleuca TaxID=9646 RepID=A0A7N5K6N8_AILME
MKVLILTCLVAVALARPKLPLRHPKLIQNEADSREQYLSELSRQRELLKEKQNDVLKGQAVEDPEQRQSSSSSSSEEQLRRLSKYNQQQQETIHDQQQLRGVNENNLLQLPFQQFYQLDAYPFAAWYYLPQIMQYIGYTPSYDIIKPIASENIENVDVVPEW